MLIETRLGRLFVEVHGAGDPVVLWPSLLCEGGMWRYQVPALATRYRVINIDPPGHGRSAQIHRAFSLEDCADAAVEILDALGIERAHWVGLSWGGMTGMRLALRHPKRIRSLALLDSSAHRESKRKLPMYLALKAIGRTLGPGLPLLLDRIGPIFLAKRTLAEKPEIERDLRRHVAAMDKESALRCLDAVIFDRTDIVPRLGEIRAPTLVMVGAEDTATPPRRARAIADGIPGARYLEIAGAGHLSALEAPEAVNEALLGFLSGVA